MNNKKKKKKRSFCTFYSHFVTGSRFLQPVRLGHPPHKTLVVEETRDTDSNIVIDDMNLKAEQTGCVTLGGIVRVSRLQGSSDCDPGELWRTLRGSATLLACLECEHHSNKKKRKEKKKTWLDAI